MMGGTVTRLLLVSILSAVTSVCLAQGHPPRHKNDAPAPRAATAPTSAEPRPAQVGTSFSDSVPISVGQFFRALKEVSVTYAVAPSFATFMSAAEQQQVVGNALAHYGIAVRPHAPVALLVTLHHNASTLTSTKSATDSPEVSEQYLNHHVILLLQFFVRGAVVRNGQVHLITAAPAYASYIFSVHDGGETRRMLSGDEVTPAMKKSFAKYVEESLKDIANSTKVDDQPWPVSGWSAKQKSAVNGEVSILMTSQLAGDERPIEGIDSARLELTPNVSDQACEGDPSWEQFWKTELVRLGWTKSAGESSPTLKHMWWCLKQRSSQQSGGPAYVWLMDAVYLEEPNVAFQLHGGWVRTRVLLFSTSRMATALSDQVQATSQGYVARSILEFASDLTLGNRSMPVISPAANLR